MNGIKSSLGGLLCLAAGIIVFQHHGFAQSQGVLAAQPGVGAKYGTRDPWTCNGKKEPVQGALSADLAAQYFLCDFEKVYVNQLYLADNVRVEVGKGRPFQVGVYADTNMRDIDVQYPVYPIRGSFTKYQCSLPGFKPLGQNCMLYPQPNAQGACYKTTFGDWKCHMADLNNPTEGRKTYIAGPK